MKTTILITALFSAAIAAPAPRPALGTDVDRSQIAARDLDTRASCPSGQNCVGGYCTVYTCVPAGTSTQCFTYKYNKC
ncbi:hypothetical protein FSPOR_8007 [Fusarium sporotrichioides]|uniref:Uncharacterized protein n=1 Tax=Fusarium sporotrichioides TaxID=5514 RepID=A0A395RWJ4_FUSSP|nr:hypothetical protein FSPOR_8007 [Fusarium sporotrichioides]